MIVKIIYKENYIEWQDISNIAKDMNGNIFLDNEQLNLDNINYIYLNGERIYVSKEEINKIFQKNLDDLRKKYPMFFHDEN